VAQKTSTLTIITDPVEAAKAAHLRYVNDKGPGISRGPHGKGFIYFDVNGNRITDAEVRKWIEALVIPPAWTEVWISSDPNGHILATGRDAKGRKQYIYHPRWNEVREETKFNRMIAFGEVLPKIREQVEHDMRRRGLPREKVLATVVRLLETTMIRVGNDEYARANASYGLTTLRDKHVAIEGSKLEFHFWGKSGKEHIVDLKDKRLARIVQECRDIPGYELFQYQDENGQRQVVDSGDVNAYLREIAGEDFTAKDFRTWGGTVEAVRVLLELGPADSSTAVKRQIAQAVKQVAAQLGNTATICRKYYIHPSVLSCYADGSLFKQMEQIQTQIRLPNSPYELNEIEAITIEFLRRCGVS
jgi:DNA topoisomerase-1